MRLLDSILERLAAIFTRRPALDRQAMQALVRAHGELHVGRTRRLSQ